MRLKKGKFAYKVALNSIIQAYVIGSSNYALRQVHPQEIYNMFARDRIIGLPQFIALDMDRLIFYPAPDKSYYVEVTGTVIKTI